MFGNFRQVQPTAKKGLATHHHGRIIRTVAVVVVGATCWENVAYLLKERRNYTRAFIHPPIPPFLRRRQNTLTGMRRTSFALKGTLTTGAQRQLKVLAIQNILQPLWLVLHLLWWVDGDENCIYTVYQSYTKSRRGGAQGGAPQWGEGGATHHRRLHVVFSAFGVPFFFLLVSM